MLRLDQRYFRSFSLLFFITLVITSITGYVLLKKIEINNHRTMLINMIEQFSILDNNEAKIEEIIHQIKRDTGVRVTIIDASGVVIYESNRKVKGMENHLNRPEVIAALKDGIGSSVRYSKSVQRDFLYVAKRVGMRYIRMAYALQSIQEKFFQFWIKAMILFTLALFGALWIAMRINRKISEDIEHINISLENLLNKKYEVDFDEVKCCQEFDTIAKQIGKVSKKLEKRDRQKAKYTKNLKLLSQKQSDIISAISHEFKNPVAAIVGYAQTVREDEDLSPTIRKKFLDKVIKNAQKISSMIDRLSLAIKLENENFLPEYTHFTLLALAEDVRETVLQKYTTREVVLDIENVTINADRIMFENLLTNLIENALKYSEDEIVVRFHDGKVEVIDKGIGIEQADLENITKRFFRVDSLSWDNSIGVGLYIVKYILKLHNSYLEINSEPNIGSTFWFDISHLLDNGSNKKN